MKTKKRAGQHKDESAIEYLRRIVHNLDYEPESLLEDLKSIDALVDYFELWGKYGTDLFVGIEEAIEEGESAAPLKRFVKKYNLNWEIPISKKPASASR